MKHNDIPGAMPTLKFDVTNGLNEVRAMVDGLAACPPGHDRAGHLCQQINSKIDGIAAAVDRVQPDQVEAPRHQGVVAREEEVPRERGHHEDPEDHDEAEHSDEPPVHERAKV